VVTCILVGVVHMGVFKVFIFGCSAYIRRLLFVFSVSPVSVCLEQRSGCLIIFAVQKKKSQDKRFLWIDHNFMTSFRVIETLI